MSGMTGAPSSDPEAGLPLLLQVTDVAGLSAALAFLARVTGRDEGRFSCDACNPRLNGSPGSFVESVASFEGRQVASQG